MPVNQALENASSASSEPLLEEQMLGQARDFVAQRLELRELLASVDQKIETVKPEIAERVREDYARRLAQLEEAFQPVRSRLIESLTRVVHHELSVKAKLEAIDDELAELDFRVRVGELPAEQLAAAAAPIQERRKRCVLKLNGAKGALNSLEPLLEDFGQLLSRLEEAGTPSVETTAELEQETPSTGAGRLSLDEIANAPGITTVIIGRTPEQGAELPETTQPQQRSLEVTGLAIPSSTAANPLPSEPGWLLRIAEEGDSEESRSHRLEGAVFTIGRARSNDAVIQGASISRLHAVIRWQGGAFVIEDASSGGGVLVNGVAINRHVLEDGDAIQIESASFLFKVSW
jgi:hypothetical protein